MTLPIWSCLPCASICIAHFMCPGPGEATCATGRELDWVLVDPRLAPRVRDTKLVPEVGGKPHHPVEVGEGVEEELVEHISMNVSLKGSSWSRFR